MKNLYSLFLLLFIWAYGSVVFAQKKEITPADLPHSAARMLVEQLAKHPTGGLKKETPTTDRGGVDYRVIARRADDLDVASGDWVFNDSSLYTYDDKDRLVELTSRSFDGSNWVYSKQTLYTYDANNNLTEFLTRDWTGTAWENDIRYQLQYDANNNPTLFLYQSWDVSDWVNVLQFVDVYDANANLTQSTTQEWNGVAWENQDRSMYQYDLGGNITQYTYQTWDGASWVNDSQSLYANNLDGNPVERVDQIWDVNAWVNANRILSEYTGNLLTQELYQYWGSGSWGDEYRRVTYTYDNNGNQTLRLSQGWDGTAWQDQDRTVSTFDAANNLLSNTSQQWDGATWINADEYLYAYDANGNTTFDQYRIWFNGDLAFGYRNFYYYEAYVGLFDKPTAGFDLHVAPNPGTGIFTLTLPVATDVQVQISDVLGRQVFSQTSSGQAQARLDLNRLPEGNYLLRASTTDGRQVAQWLQIRR